jgi:hypothetical protein
MSESKNKDNRNEKLENNDEGFENKDFIEDDENMSHLLFQMQVIKEKEKKKILKLLIFLPTFFSP